jgi:uncharacterized protein YjbI with pentapeptide repeats
MAADRPDLSSEERAILTNIEDYRRATQHGPFRLANRSIAGIELPAIDFAGAEFTEIDFSSTRFTGTRFTRSALRGVRFDACEFSGAAFTVCDADDLGFVNCEVERVDVAGTSIRKLFIEDCTVSGGTWSDMQIDEFSATRTTFVSPAWIDVVCRGARWRRCTLRGARLQHVAFEEGELTQTSIVDAVASGLEFRGTVIQGMELMLGVLEGLRFEAVSGGGIHVADAACKAVQLVLCENVTGVTVSGGECGLVFVDRCKYLSLLTIGHTRLGGLSLVESAITGLTIRSVRLTGDCIVWGCVLDGLDCEGSDVRGLNVMNTLIETLLRVPRARFSGLRLQFVQYSPSLEIDAEGTVYTDGDSFPGPGVSP